MDSIQLSLSTAEGNLLNINETTVSQAMNSYLCSTKYLRHVVPLTMFYIVYNRIDYDPDNYVETNIKDWNYVILNKHRKNESLNNLYVWAYGAMEALQVGCLSQLFLKILDKNETIEYYHYTFQYCKNAVITKPKGSTKEIIRLTRHWFEKFAKLRKFVKIPATATLSVEVVLTEKPTKLKLLDYIPTEKSDVYNPRKEERRVKHLLDLGGINTEYHKVRAYCKIKSIGSDAGTSPIGSGEIMELSEDDAVAILGPVPMELCDDLNNNDIYHTANRDDFSNIEESQVLNDHPLRQKTKVIVKGTNNQEKEKINRRKSKNPKKHDSIPKERATADLIAEKLINYHDTSAGKGKSMTIFGDTTIEPVEQETFVLPLRVSSKSNLEIVQAEIHAEQIKKLKTKHVEVDDSNPLLIKKSKTRVKTTKKYSDENEQPNGKSKGNDLEKSPIIRSELAASKRTIPKLLEDKLLSKGIGKSMTIFGDTIIEPLEQENFVLPLRVSSKSNLEVVQAEIHGEQIKKLKTKHVEVDDSNPLLIKKSKTRVKTTKKYSDENEQPNGKSKGNDLEKSPIITSELAASKRTIPKLFEDKLLSKGIGKSVTIFEDTIIEPLEQENFVLPLRVSSKSNLEVVQAEIHGEPIKKLKTKHVEVTDSNPTLIKKPKTRGKANKKHSTNENEPPNTSETSSIIPIELPTIQSKIPEDKLVTKGKGKIAIIGNITIEPINVIEPEESVSESKKSDKVSEGQSTPQSELFINNELVPKGKRVATKMTYSNLISEKKARRYFKDGPKKVKNLEYEKPAQNVATEKEKINDSIFDDTTIQLTLSPSSVVKLTPNEENKANTESRNNTGAKRKSIKNIERCTNSAKKSKGNTEEATQVLLEKNEMCREYASKIPTYSSPNSFDSLTLGETPKRPFASINQPQDSSKFESFTSTEQNSSTRSTELGGPEIGYDENNLPIICDDDVQSISSTSSDNRYINNRIQFG